MSVACSPALLQPGLPFDPEELAGRFGTPLYIYALHQVLDRVRVLQAIPYWPKRLYFASMCNTNPVLLARLRQEGLGLFVNSPKHLTLGLKVGFQPADIIYTATNMSEADLRAVDDVGAYVNLDSVGQITAYGRVAPGSAVGMRINFDNDMGNGTGGGFLGPQSRIGITEAELPQALATARHAGLVVNGVHVYLGTNIQDVGVFLRGTDRLIEIARRLPDLAHLDLGGGFPARQSFAAPEFDYAGYGNALAQRMEALSEEVGRPVRLVLEPGRCLMAEGGYFLTRVTDVKDRDCGPRYVGVDASVDIFPRPLLNPQDGYHEVRVVGKERWPLEATPTHVVGCTTYSRDCLASTRLLPKVTAGDLLLFHNAGAYCYSMITDFLGRTRPAEVLVEDGACTLIRAAETLDLPVPARNRRRMVDGDDLASSCKRQRPRRMQA
jgi:diaminopimelate decarboxylase